MENKFSDVKAKIAKLLALAADNRGSDEESQTALLMARKLMAKYNLEMADVEGAADKGHVSDYSTDISFSKKRDAWAGRLANVIAKAHRCEMVLSTRTGSRTYTVKFVGFKEDLELASAIFKAAHTYVYRAGSDLWYAAKKKGYSTEDLRSIYDSYGIGFAEGLAEKYREQDASEEACTAMMVVTPEAVSKYTRSIVTGSRDTSSSHSFDRDAYGKGYEEGKKFTTRNLGVAQLKG